MRLDTSQVDQVVDALKDSGRDFRPAYREAANIMRKSFAENFRQGGRPDRWEPLKRGTIAAKAMSRRSVYATAAGRSSIRRLAQVNASGQTSRSVSNILIQSGEYRDSWVQKSAHHFERINHDGFEIGSKHRLAEIHEFGTGVHGPKGEAYAISPIRARALRFSGPAGRTIYAARVMNPGVPARPVGIIQDEDVEVINEVLAEHWLSTSGRISRLKGPQNG